MGVPGGSVSPWLHPRGLGLLDTLCPLGCHRAQSRFHTCRRVSGCSRPVVVEFLMSEPIILAVDLGTSGMKVALITVAGEVLGWESEPVRLIITPDGGAEQSPEEWWQAFLSAAGGGLLFDSGRRHDRRRFKWQRSRQRHPVDGHARRGVPSQAGQRDDQ